jgi:hypothetical protein
MISSANLGVAPGDLMNMYPACSRKYSCAWVLLFSGLLSLNAQIVHIDTVTPINTINPRDSVGAGVDRIPVEAIDRDLTKQALAPVLQSGWQPVTYRQNTDLAIEAWH